MPSDQNMVNCLIIDDDPFVHDLLTDKLAQYFPELALIGKANSGNEGLISIQKLKPDLVFLDVEIGDMTGFEMLAQIKEISFSTIFITSYSHYAIKAIRFNALDYLLKPFDIEELKQAIQRFKNKANKELVENALDNLSLTDIADQTFILRTQEGELRMTLKEIVGITGDRNYSKIHRSNGKVDLVARTLSSLEEVLTDKGFYRIHKSCLVNFLHVENINKNNEAIMSNGQLLPISRRKKPLFINWMTINEKT